MKNNLQQTASYNGVRVQLLIKCHVMMQEKSANLCIFYTIHCYKNFIEH